MTEGLARLERGPDRRWRIPPSVIYGSQETAAAWLDVTESPDYPYYREECELVEDLTASGHLWALDRYSLGVFLGAADANKERLLLAGLRDRGNDLDRLICIDSSPPLLNMATRALRAVGLRDVEGLVADFSSPATFQDQHYFSPDGPARLFTIFGNTVGNYENLSVIEALGPSLRPGDRLLLGIHRKAESGPDTDTYTGYSSDAYLGHMRCALVDAGVDPSSGQLVVTVDERGGEVDVVEILFLLEPHARLITNSGAVIGSGTPIVVDVSAKFGVDWAAKALGKLGIGVEEYWLSRSELVCLFLCGVE